MNLAENTATPQDQQAAAAKINAQRFQAGVKLRGVAATNYGMSRAKVDLSDRAAVERYLHTRIATLKRPEQASERSRLQSYLQLTAEPGKLENDYEDLAAALAKACQPRPHHFTIGQPRCCPTPACRT